MRKLSILWGIALVMTALTSQAFDSEDSGNLNTAPVRDQAPAPPLSDESDRPINNFAIEESAGGGETTSSRPLEKPTAENPPDVIKATPPRGHHPDVLPAVSSKTGSSTMPSMTSPSSADTTMYYGQYGYGSVKLNSKCGKGWVSKTGGAYGNRGRMLVNAILNSPMKHLFLGKVEGMEAACEGFDNFSQRKKLNLWVIMFANIAHTESGCDEGSPVHNRCEDGHCGGELQMPEFPDLRDWRLPMRYREGLPENHEKHKVGCRADYRKSIGDWSTDSRHTIECAVETMGGMLCGRHRYKGVHDCSEPTHPFTPPTPYWEALKDGRIKASLKKSPICQKTARETK